MNGVSWTLGAAALATAAWAGLLHATGPHPAGVVLPLVAFALGMLALVVPTPRGSAAS